MQEPTGLAGRLEAKGYFPPLSPIRKQGGERWMDGDTANLSIGHGEILVTPLQMVVMVSAIANGGLLYAVGLMAAGWDNAPKRNAPGFPANGQWNVRWESLSPGP